jgi:hypothetical protein
LFSAEQEKLALEMRLLQQDRVATKQLLVVTDENFNEFHFKRKNFQNAEKKGLKRRWN